MRNLELPCRSPVIATGGVAATSHYLATQTAISTLQNGGNAMDAAIAACAVQCVVEPESTGVGGDCFCLYAPAGAEKPIAFNGSGRAPAAATAEWYAAQSINEIERQSPHSVTVPGAVDAWHQLLRDHGTMAMGDILTPAIGYARDGYPVGSRVSADFAVNVEILKDCENSARVFLPGGKPIPRGEIHHQPELAGTLQKIATQGRDGFYKGEVAQDIVDYLQSRGGLHTMDDFANAAGDYVEPITAKYRGYDVFQCPPNGQGVIALMLLKLMERFEKSGDTPINVERIHQEIEAGRLTYHQRDAWLADPDQSNIPVDWLLSDANIDQLYQSIQADGAATDLPDFQPPNHKDTVYITVVDKDRNACSFINTLFDNFGTGWMAPKSGVVLQNRGQGFTLEAGHPNCIAPGKRPLHTIIPGMIMQDGKTVMSYGVMGGQYQAFGHMQFLSRHLQYGLDVQEAQDLPRFFPNPETGNVEVEGAIPQEVLDGLRALGHSIVPTVRPIGGSQAIWIDHERGTLTGGSDPRKDGCAIGY
jgi:gamma-glutamyltranspeptidase/glutathione hydrolase